jgi:restriction endonuclease Mrr
MFGFGPLSSAPIGGLPDDFSAKLEIEQPVGSNSITRVVSFVDRELIAQLHRDPNNLLWIDRRKFEEIVAELFNGFGYQVELTQRTRDGGKDIIAIKQEEVELRFLIECKRPDPNNLVGVGIVRELLGVKTDDGASKAILATTSYFTADAKQLFERHRWELEPRDFDGIKAWIAEYARRKGL